jgi:hypothetical protein
MQGATDEASIPIENERSAGSVLKYFNPFSTMPPPQDEDNIPARKRRRLDALSTSSSVSTTAYDVTVTGAGPWTAEEDAIMTDEKHGNDTVKDAHTTANNKKYRSWTPQEDTKLIDAVTEHGDDWARVAAMVPDRKHHQCRYRWVSYLDPSIDRTSTYSKGAWKAQEDANLTDAVTKHGNSWLVVAALLPGRTAQQCSGRWRKHLNVNFSRTTPRWTAEEDALLVDSEYKHGNDWVAVATLIPNRNNVQCYRRWKVLPPTMKRATPMNKGPWKPEEVQKLTDAVTELGKDWVQVAALVPGRTFTQCRYKWAESFDPIVDQTNVPLRTTGKWTLEEDAQLADAVKEHGGSNFTTVAAMVTGRTTVQCRQRWSKSWQDTNDNNTGEWTVEEMQKLTDAVTEHGEHWPRITALVPGRTNAQCRQRWAESMDTSICWTTPRAGTWTAQEDAMLTDAIKKHGTYWVKVAAVVPGRTNIQCRYRWVRYLEAIHLSGE